MELIDRLTPVILLTQLLQNLTDRQTDRQTGRQTDKQTSRQAGRQADRQTDKQTEFRLMVDTTTKPKLLSWNYPVSLLLVVRCVTCGAGLMAAAFRLMAAGFMGVSSIPGRRSQVVITGTLI